MNYIVGTAVRNGTCIVKEYNEKQNTVLHNMILDY